MTLETILQRINAFVTQDASTPTGSDLSTMISYVNEALDKWAMVYDWGALIKSHTETATSDAEYTITLDDNFKKLITPVYDQNDNEYQEIPARDRFGMDDNAYYCYVMGNRKDGFTLYLPNNVKSGDTLEFDYAIYPDLLSDVSDEIIPDVADYLVQYGVARLLGARSDARYPHEEAKAETLLANMIENENSKLATSGSGQIQNRYWKDKNNYRIGRA